MLALSSKGNKTAEEVLPTMCSGGWIHLRVWVNSMSLRMGFFLRSVEMEAIDL